jgi:serine/threonine protein kinase
MLHCSKADHRLSLEEFHSKRLHQAEVKMIDFSNIDQLKEYERDWGGLTFKTHEARSDLIVGKREYFSPELTEQVFQYYESFFNNKKIEPFCQTALDNLWSLGAIFCELLTGKHPFYYLNAY